MFYNKTKIAISSSDYLLEVIGLSINKQQKMETNIITSLIIPLSLIDRATRLLTFGDVTL